MLRALNSRNVVDSPPDIQQLQLASPVSGEEDKKSEWPTSFDTSTMGGSVPGRCIFPSRVPVFESTDVD
jgi:hypothetical protein